MSFKGNKIWVETQADGNFLEKNNKVHIKYNLMQDYEYWIKKEQLKPEDQAIPAAKKKKKRADGKTPNQKEIPLPPNCIRIYTDGASSGNPGPSGIGAVLIYKEHQKQISKYIGHATNNIAELTAIKEALLALKRKDLPVRVFTDSQYCIRMLTKGHKANSNKALIAQISGLLNQFKDIEMIKVKGHSGIKENELADFLATSAHKKRG